MINIIIFWHPNIIAVMLFKSPCTAQNTNNNVQNYDDKPFTMTTEANVYVSCSILTHTMRGLNAIKPNDTYNSFL
jgi:hypothetical protein